MVYRLFSSLLGFNNAIQEQVPEDSREMNGEVEDAAASAATTTTFAYTVDDTFGDEVSIKNPVVQKYNSKRRNSKRFVIGEDDAEDSSQEALLMVPDPDWLKASAKLKPGTTLT